MATIVYQINKKTGVKYAYSTQSYRDPVTKKPRVHRTYLGIVDPKTQVIIPKAVNGKRDSSNVNNQEHNSQTPVTKKQTSSLLVEKIQKLKEEIKELKAENAHLRQQIHKVKSIVDESTIKST